MGTIVFVILAGLHVAFHSSDVVGTITLYIFTTLLSIVAVWHLRKALGSGLAIRKAFNSVGHKTWN